MTQVLIIDPDQTRRQRLRLVLTENGYGVTDSGCSLRDAQAIASLEPGGYRCIIASVEPGGLPACALLGAETSVPVILVASRADVRQAVAAIKSGAAEYLADPIADDELVAAVERSIAEHTERDAATGIANAYPIIGNSPAMQELFARIAKIGPTDSTVIIRGESGTGKELIARALHAASRRAHAPMISLNCASIPPRLIETELFGYSASGASADRTRTGLLEAANGGTLFLDEIGELEPEAQARLLRVLQAGELRRFGAAETFRIDVRLITSTQRDLGQLVAAGQFREDLYYRLNVVALEAPPLRERGDDILLVADFILERTRARLAKPSLAFSEDARQAMLRYRWPGNVRELENCIERAAILSDQETIPAEFLAIDTARQSGREAPPGSTDQTSLEDYFVSFVLANQDQLTETELADKLGISRKSLWERRQRLNIPRKRTRQRAPRRDEG